MESKKDPEKGKKKKEKREKPKYNMWQNTGFMLKAAFDKCKSVPFMCLALALTASGKAVLELLVTPTVLSGLEGGAGPGSLFASLVPKAGLAWLGSPWFATAMLALMLLAAFAASKLYYASESVWRSFDAQGRFGNRLFSFFGFTCYDEKRAADMRIYCQNENICAPSMERAMFSALRAALPKRRGERRAGWERCRWEYRRC